MTVKELIDKLEGLPKDLPVFMEEYFAGQVPVRDAVVEEWPKDISMGRDGKQVMLH